MADFTPVWPLNRYDDQGTGKCPYRPGGYDLKAAAFLGTSTKPESEAVIAYSEILDQEIIYIGTRDVNTHRVVATDSDGTQYWETGNLQTASADLTSFISLSNDSENIYATFLNYDTLYALYAVDGTTNWSYTFGSGVSWSYHALSHVIPIGNNIFYAWDRLYAPDPFTRDRYVSVNKSSSDGTGVVSTIVDTWKPDVNNNVTPAGFVSNDANSYVYFAYSLSLTLYPSDTGRTRIAKCAVSDLSASTIAITRTGADENMYPVGISFNNDYIYVTTKYGLVKVDDNDETQKWRHAVTGTNISSPTIDTNGIIYYRVDNHLYAIQDDGNSYTQLWDLSIFPNSSISPIIDADENIYIASDNSTGDNIYIVDTSGNYLSSFRTGATTTDTIEKTPILGHFFDSNQLYYVPIQRSTGTQAVIYILHSETPVTTTTTTSSTTSTPTTTTTTTTPSTSTTTSTPTTTTTTTTLPPTPLSHVETVFYEFSNGQSIQLSGTNASDSDETIDNERANTLTFGTLAPGETSKTLIIQLKIPYASAIGNIKLGLTNAGGITFADDLFGISYSQNLRVDIEPSEYFEGVNTTKSSSSPYNISIPTINKNNSQYVYINVTLPTDHEFGVGIVRFKWYFDYAD